MPKILSRLSNNQPIYRTKYGKYFNSTIEDILNSDFSEKYKGKINLIFTSPPFPLNKKKSYGNLKGEEYLNWFSSLSILFKNLLAPNGSIVIELGNAWEKGHPSMSLLPLQTMLEFIQKGNLKLCQQFIWHNTAKLPTPAHWVNIKRIRVKDNYTNIWWLSKNYFPKASNRRVLIEYSDGMKSLLKNQKYNFGTRPSEHKINETSFLKTNKGAIPGNVISCPNTFINEKYKKYCIDNDLELHPARMPIAIPEFFIKFLTTKNDIVMDPFAGSNTTGEAAEKLSRKWISVDSNLDFIKGSKGRFT